MKFKKLTKVLSAVLVSAALLTAVPASAATYQGAPTYEQNNSYYNQTIKVQDVTVDFVTAYIHSANNVWNTTYGVCHYTANIIVSNLSYDKTIVMHYQTADGTWTDSNKATYVKSLGNGKELWTLSGYLSSPAQFVFNYKEANAWDNNNNQNYRLRDFDAFR
ncbi:MAG: hypothetical protein V8R02_06170 [Clostridium sp.]